jgi:hypothetical protein
MPPTHPQPRNCFLAPAVLGEHLGGILKCLDGVEIAGPLGAMGGDRDQ